MSRNNYKIVKHRNEESGKIGLKKEMTKKYPDSGPIFDYIADKLIHAFGEKYPEHTMQMIDKVAEERGVQ